MQRCGTATIIHPEQGLLAVVHAMKAWNYILDGLPADQVMLVTNHNPLVWLQSQYILFRQQARWMELLARINHQWLCRPGRLYVADPVSSSPAVT